MHGFPEKMGTVLSPPWLSHVRGDAHSMGSPHASPPPSVKCPLPPHPAFLLELFSCFVVFSYIINSGEMSLNPLSVLMDAGMDGRPFCFSDDHVV